MAIVSKIMDHKVTPVLASLLEGLGTSFGWGRITFRFLYLIAQHLSLREKLAESVDSSTAATDDHAQWDEDGKYEAGPGQSEATALASHLPE